MLRENDSRLKLDRIHYLLRAHQYLQEVRSRYIEANKQHVKDRLTEIYRRPGIV
jgi:hypothetical protein